MLGFVRRALWLEVSLYVCLARWVLRRPSVGPGQQPIGYARAVTRVLCPELQIGVSGQVNVVVELRAPVAVRTSTGPLQVSAVRFFVDEPREVVTRLRESLAARDARRA